MEAVPAVQPKLQFTGYLIPPRTPNLTLPICPNDESIPRLIPIIGGDSAFVQIKCSNHGSNENQNYFSIANYFDSLRFSDKRAQKQICTYNPVHKMKPAFTYCLFCRKWLCNSCIAEHINMNNSSSEKHCFCPEEVNIQINCIEHNEHLKYFCANCQENLCGKCKENHKPHHKLTPFDSIITEKDIARAYDEYNTRKINYFDMIKLNKEIVTNAWNERINEIKELIKQIEKWYEINYNISQDFAELAKCSFIWNQYTSALPSYNMLMNLKDAINFNDTKFDYDFCKSVDDNAIRLINYYKSNYFINISETMNYKPKTVIKTENEVTCICQVTNKSQSLSVVGYHNGLIDAYLYPKWTKSSSLIGHTGSILYWTQLSNRAQLLSSSFDKSICVWNWNTFTLINKITGHKYSVKCVIEISNGNFVSCGEDTNIKFWDCEKFNCFKTIPQAHYNSINCLMMWKDGRLFSGSTDCYCSIWNLEATDANERVSFNTNKSGVLTCLQWKDERILVGMLNGSIAAFGLLSLKCWGMFNGHKGGIRKIIEWSDGSVVTASMDSTVRVWMGDSYKCRQNLWKHGKDVNAVCEIENALITGSRDKTLILWEC